MKRQLSVLVSAMAVLVIGVGVAFAAGLLRLPSEPVTVVHGDWLAGTQGSTLDIDLLDVPSGYDVTNGTYVGWCLEDNFLPDPPDYDPYLLVDSTDDPVNFPSPCENYADIPWDLVNYLLNHKPASATAWDVQLALWEIAGTESGIYDPLPGLAQLMVDETNTLGPGFAPGIGDVVAVAICADGIDVWTGDGTWQDTIVEVPILFGGCTPGYWKAPQHFDSWPAAFDPTTPPSEYFDDIFGVGPHITLLQALKMNGGGENALLRHATAALLDAASPDVVYPYTVAEVIARVHSAYQDGDFELYKNQLAFANEGLCPLN